MTAPPVTDYPTPVIGTGDPAGLTFATDGSGLEFDAGYPLTFPSDPPGDLGALFPTVMPQVEQIVYQTVNDAAQGRIVFPEDGAALTLPAAFQAPLITLYPGQDSSYTIPAGPNAGQPVPPIPVSRALVLAYPGSIPAIAVGEAHSSEDASERTTQGGFAGDVYATDGLGNILATCAYYATPWKVTVVVQLIHENRDERDRLHDQLWRVLAPLRHIIADESPQVRDVQLDSDKTDLPVDEQPIVIYVSVFTVEVECEVLVPTEITYGGVITQIITTVTPTEVIEPDAGTDLT